MAEPWNYLKTLEPEAGAPVVDNPSGLYCPACRALGGGISHCAHPEYCGGMRPMRPKISENEDEN